MKINIFKQVNINVWILTENIQWITLKHCFYGQSILSLITDIHTAVSNYNTRTLNIKTSTKGQKGNGIHVLMLR